MKKLEEILKRLINLKWNPQDLSQSPVVNERVPLVALRLAHIYLFFEGHLYGEGQFVILYISRGEGRTPHGRLF